MSAPSPQTDTHSPSPPDQATSPAAPGGRKVWTAGSLSYTAGGLALLLLLLLGGDFAWSMRERSVQPLFQILLRQYESSDFLTSLLLGSIPACITVLVWPVVSVWSDRTRTRWGRRIPFLFFPTPFIFGAMVDEKLDDQVWVTVVATGYGGHAVSATLQQHNAAVARYLQRQRQQRRGTP